MIRNELESFVEKLFTARHHRRDFVNQNRRETRRFLEDAKRSRMNQAREIEQRTSNLRQSLQQSNRKHRTQVSRLLQTMHNQRMGQATQERIQRLGGVAKIKRYVQRTIRDHASERVRNARQLHRQTQSTLREIRSRVHSVKQASHTLTARVANDLRACRRAWARLRRQPAH